MKKRKRQKKSAPPAKKIEPAINKAVIYARYSSEHQNEQSIEGQIRVCTDYAERNGIVIVDTYIDRATTGRNDNRSSFQRMIKNSAKGEWSIVLVYKLDRFSRNKYDMATNRKELRNNGVKLISASENIPDTPEGILLESLLEGMAEYYSAELSQKTLRGQRESRLKGNYPNGVPIGYKLVNAKVEVDEQSAQIVKTMFQECANGKTTAEILNVINCMGYRTKKGTPFTHKGLEAILHNERYIGIYRHHTEGEYTNIFPPIISKELFEEARLARANNKSRGRPQLTDYFLSKKLTCGLCGEPFVVLNTTSETGKTNYYYRCKGRRERTCTLKFIRKEFLEGVVVDAVIQALNTPDNIEALASKIEEVNKQKTTDNPIIAKLISEQKATEEAINNLLKAITMGITSDTTKQRLVELEKKLETISNDLEFEQTREMISISKEEIKKHILDALNENPSVMINTLVEKIVLFPDKVEIFFKLTNKKRPDESYHQVFAFFTKDFETKEGILRVQIFI